MLTHTRRKKKKFKKNYKNIIEKYFYFIFKIQFRGKSTKMQ